MSSTGDGGWAAGSEEFPTTHWALVRRLGDRGSPEIDAALDWLCNSYWRPIYAYIRRRGHPPDRACDLTQDFFASILAGAVAAPRTRPGAIPGLSAGLLQTFPVQ